MDEELLLAMLLQALGVEVEPEGIPTRPDTIPKQQRIVQPQEPVAQRQSLLRNKPALSEGAIHRRTQQGTELQRGPEYPVAVSPIQQKWKSLSNKVMYE